MADFRAWQREILDAAEWRDWIVQRLDMREGVVLEEPIEGGITIRISGRSLSPAFVRSLPLAGMASARRMLDGSPCWCVSSDEPHEGWSHAPRCLERRGELAP